MVTLRSKILRPFLTVIVLTPIATMILFNISLSHYAKIQAEKDLTYVANNITDSFTDDEIMRIFPFIRSQLGSSTVEIIVYNKLGSPAKFLDFTNSFVTEEIANKTYNMLNVLPLGEIGSFSIEGDDYYIIEVEYSSRGIYERIVYISKGLFLDDYVTTVNLLLLIISFFITAIAVFISSKVTKSIAKPLEQITNSIENVRPNELLSIDTNSDNIEIQKLANEFNIMNNRIYQAHNSQKSFLHNASHELRTPLMNIQGYADGIEMGIFEDARGTAHLISEQSKRLTKIVDGLLALARAENFNADTQLEQLNISDSLLEILNEYKGYAIKNNITIETEIPPKIIANANDELLIGAVGNIISNAIRYAHKTISISLKKRDSKVVIIIKDDGIGIQDINKIYDKFTKGKDGNFGLGLSIAKTSVEMMYGNIKVYNEDGAVFEIILNIE